MWVIDLLYQLCLCGVCFCVCAVCKCALVLYKVLNVVAASRDRQLLWCVFDFFLRDGTWCPDMYELIMYQHVNILVCCCDTGITLTI